MNHWKMLFVALATVGAIACGGSEEPAADESIAGTEGDTSGGDMSTDTTATDAMPTDTAAPEGTMPDTTAPEGTDTTGTTEGTEGTEGTDGM